MSVGLTPAVPASTIDRSIDAATDALLGLQRPDGHWVFELEADATIPAEYVLLRHYLAEPVDVRVGNQDRRLSASHPGRARRMAAVPRRRLRHEREREGLFRAQDDRRRGRCPAHGACARSDPLARWRIARECVHAADAGAFRVHPVACGPGHAGGDHAASDLVSVSPRQDFVLEPDRYCAAAGAAGAQAQGAQPQGGQASTNSSSSRRRRSARPRRHRSRRPRGSGCSVQSIPCCMRSSRSFRSGRGDARSTRAEAWVGERLNGEDGLGAIFPAMANSVMMFDALGYPEASSATRHRARVDREAAGDARG